MQNPSLPFVFRNSRKIESRPQLISHKKTKRKKKKKKVKKLNLNKPRRTFFAIMGEGDKAGCILRCWQIVLIIVGIIFLVKRFFFLFFVFLLFWPSPVSLVAPGRLSVWMHLVKGTGATSGGEQRCFVSVFVYFSFFFPFFCVFGWERFRPIQGLLAQSPATRVRLLNTADG
jgi:hypothetical protein